VFVPWVVDTDDAVRVNLGRQSGAKGFFIGFCDLRLWRVRVPGFDRYGVITTIPARSTSVSPSARRPMKELTAAEEAKIGALVKKAVS
jgi:hypothetical protein